VHLETTFRGKKQHPQAAEPSRSQFTVSGGKKKHKELLDLKEEPKDSLLPLPGCPGSTFKVLPLYRDQEKTENICLGV